MKLKKILKESNAPGFKNRKFGEPLPTLDSVQKKKNEEKLNEENENTWTIMYKGLLAGFKKAKDGRLDVVAKAVAFLIKTEYGRGAKNDFIKALKKNL